MLVFTGIAMVFGLIGGILASISEVLGWIVLVFFVRHLSTPTRMATMNPDIPASPTTTGICLCGAVRFCIDRAVEAFPEAEAIYERNIATLDALGADGWAALQKRWQG